MYTFNLKIEQTGSRLVLLENGIEKAAKEWPEARDMGRQLFQAITELLKEHGLKPEAVGDFVVESALPDVYTSSRIAETVKKVYAFGVEVKNK